MKKAALILVLLLITSVPCPADPLTDANRSIRKYCPSSGGTYINSASCLQAHNVKIQLSILKELKNMNRELLILKKELEEANLKMEELERK